MYMHVRGSGISHKSKTSLRVLPYVRSWIEGSEVGGQIKDIQVLINP